MDAVKKRKSLVGFEVLTAVVAKSNIFWDITPCSPLKVNQRFGGTYRLYLQGRRISRAKDRRERRRYISEDSTLQEISCRKSNLGFPALKSAARRYTD
jgi:hypothetical protein